MGPGYVLKLLFSETSQKNFNNSATTEAREKIFPDLVSFEFYRR
jgi:hypothetical protein